MKRLPVFYLTRRAAFDLHDIYNRSRREWGNDVAKQYMTDLYAAMNKAATNPSSGLLWQHRISPFLMIPARQHFVIYDHIPQGIAILTLARQVRDIESLVSSLSPSFLQEIEKIKAENPATTQKHTQKKKK